MRRQLPQPNKKFRFPRPRVVIQSLRQLSWGGLLVVTIVSIYAVFASNLFHITAVLCTYNDRPCKKEIEAELRQLTGGNILIFRPQLLEAKLRKADIAISSVTIIPKLPHTINVTITTRNPSITIAAASGAAQVLVDDHFVPFDIEATPSASPKIISTKASTLQLGTAITDSTIKSAIILARTLNDYFVNFDTIEAEDYHLIVLLKNHLQVIFAVNGDFSSKVTSLQLILREATIQPPPKEIDLRFTKPVLR